MSFKGGGILTSLVKREAWKEAPGIIVHIPDLTFSSSLTAEVHKVTCLGALPEKWPLIMD
jgi:hypothetical protein